MKLRLFKVFAITILLLSLSSSAFAIDIYYKNNIVPTDTNPIVENGITLVPISSIAKSMEAAVSWNANTKTATIKKGSISLEMVVGSKNMTIIRGDEKSTLELDTSIKSINGRTMVPIRIISGIFGSNVQWDKNTNSILIDSDFPKTSEDIKLEKIILNKIKNHKDLFYNIKYDDKMSVNIIKDNEMFTKVSMALLNEIVPGSYIPFNIYDNNGDYMVGGFIDTKTYEVYLESSRMLYSIPDYKVIIQPFDMMVDEDSKEYAMFIKAIALRDKIISENDKILCKLTNIDYDNETIVAKLYIVNNNKRKMVGEYFIDKHARTVKNNKTKKIIYDDSALANYKETYITEDTAGDMAISILQKIKRISADKKYTVTDIKYTKSDVFTEYREGYFLKLKLDGKVVGTFFINTTSTVVMEFDTIFNQYYYIYGAFSPFG